MSIRPSQLAGSHTVVVRQLVSAPRDVVFSLWTDAARMPEWILAGGSATLDVRVGGKYELDMHYNGKSYPHHGEYLEVVPPSKLSFTWYSESTNWLPSIVTIELNEVGARTEVVLTHEGLLDPKNANDHEEGWKEIVSWLDALITKDA